MHCLVTGAAGFVGSSLTDRLLAEGHSVIGVDCFLDYYAREIKLSNLKQAAKSAKFTLQEANLLQADIDQLISKVEVVFHQAAQAGVRASWGKYFQTYCDNNVLATQRLLDAVRRSPHIKKVIYASSSSIYGNAESFPTCETALPQPVSPYGVTKLAAEHLMQLYSSQYGVPTVSLRYFTVYGPRQRPDMAFNRIAKSATIGEEFQLFGDGEQSRDFTFIDDIVRANILAVENGPSGSVFNIGGGTHATMNQVLEIFKSLVPSLKVLKKAPQVGDAKHTSADTTAARQILKFSPKVKLTDGIKLELDWMRQSLRA